MKYKIWNGIETLVTPSGKVLTPAQVQAEYPMTTIQGMKFIVCDAPINMGVFMEFEQTKEVYKGMGADIVDGMTDQEVLDAITYFETHPAPQIPTPEERMAAALEFQSMMML